MLPSALAGGLFYIAMCKYVGYNQNIGSVTLIHNREGVLFYGLATIICVLSCIPIVLKNKNEFFNKGFLKATPTMQNEHNVKSS